MMYQTVMFQTTQMLNFVIFMNKIFTVLCLTSSYLIVKLTVTIMRVLIVITLAVSQVNFYDNCTSLKSCRRIDRIQTTKGE
jgi:hypothetical protein